MYCDSSFTAAVPTCEGITGYDESIPFYFRDDELVLGSGSEDWQLHRLVRQN